MNLINPWEKGGKMYDSRVLNNVADELKFNKAQFQSNATPEAIAKSAENLATNEQIVASYRQFESQAINWVFIKNSSISGAVSKGFEKLGTWDGFNGLNTQRKQVLLDLAGLDDSSYSENSTTLSQLISAASKWNKSYYAYFVHDQNGSDLGLCNVFVGEAIFGAGKNTVISGRYPSAAMIHNNSCGYKKVVPDKAIRGTIVTMYNGGHVEIITKLEIEGFCSVGGGKGNEVETCTKKCYQSDIKNDEGDINRKLNNPANKRHSL